MTKVQAQALRKGCLHGSAWVWGNSKSKEGFKVRRFLSCLWLWFTFLVKGIENPSLNKKQGIYDVRKCITCWISCRDHTSSDPEILSVDSECVESFQIYLMILTHHFNFSIPLQQNPIVTPVKKRKQEVHSPRFAFPWSSWDAISWMKQHRDINFCAKECCRNGKGKTSQKTLATCPSVPKGSFTCTHKGNSGCKVCQFF